MAPGPVDWHLAERVAVRVAGREPLAESYHYDRLTADFERATAQAEELVARATGLRPLSGPARARVVGRDDWVRANLASFRRMLRPVIAKMGERVDRSSPMGRAMFTIIGAMAELESSLISERVTAGMRAAQARGRHLGRPATPPRVIGEIEALATSTDLSIRQIHKEIGGRASRSIVGEITKRARATRPSGL